MRPILLQCTLEGSFNSTTIYDFFGNDFKFTFGWKCGFLEKDPLKRQQQNIPESSVSLFIKNKKTKKTGNMEKESYIFL